MTAPVDTIIQGDCLTVLPQLSAGSVDFVLTVPPYLVRYMDRSGRSIRNDCASGQVLGAFSDVVPGIEAGQPVRLVLRMEPGGRVFRGLEGGRVHPGGPYRIQQIVFIGAAVSAVRPRVRLCAGEGAARAAGEPDQRRATVALFRQPQPPD